MKGFARGHWAAKHQSLARNSRLLDPQAEPFSGQREWAAMPLPRPSEVELLRVHRGTLGLNQTPSLPHTAPSPPEGPDSPCLQPDGRGAAPSSS